MKKFLIALLIFAVIICGSVIAYNSLSKKYPSSAEKTTASETLTADNNKNITEKLKDFTVVDLNGNEVNLSDFSKKPIVVNFWASWCSPCKAELPDFEEAYKEYKDKVNFLMVNVGDSNLDSVKSFVDSLEYSFPVYFDNSGSASSTYSVYSIPVTLFINADSVIVKQQIGMLTKDTLTNSIKQIIGEKL